MSVTVSTPAGLALPDLEQVYDLLADAIDQAGPARSELFLVKLNLLLAEALGERAVYADLLQRALRDL
ncbi:MAG: hypothetical protein RLY71_1791 [Pseudomonadota bacterium]|jgi:hypothetical protein